MDGPFLWRSNDAWTYWNHDGISTTLSQSFWELKWRNYQEYFRLSPSSIFVWMVQFNARLKSRDKANNVLGSLGSIFAVFGLSSPV